MPNFATPEDERLCLNDLVIYGIYYLSPSGRHIPLSDIYLDGDIEDEN